jgi:histidinol-phosphate aminotransferase
MSANDKTNTPPATGTTDNDRVVRQVRPEIRALSAYHVPDPGKLIKLDAMENPYRWPEPLLEEWLQVLRGAAINRYPDPVAAALSRILRKKMDVPDGMDIILGNGSDELIQIIATAVSGAGRVILAPEPSFVMYRMIATIAGMDYQAVPLASDFSLDLPAMLQAIEQHQPAVIFLAYPNNPTGNLFDESAIIAIIEASPGLVVLDEAYHAFAGGHSFMDRLPDYDNLVVMRTVSKMGLAGLRLGMLAGSPAWLQEFDKIRLPYNINVLTQLSAEFAMQYYVVLQQQTQKICADRETLKQQLDNIDGITTHDSQANFLLVRMPAGRATEIFTALKEKGVLVKNLHGSNDSLNDCLRVTVGTAEENQAFISALKQSL